MVGLNAGTHSKIVIIGAILIIAIADAFSDALGIHISEESENKHNQKEVWQSTLSTFLSKFFFALTFIIPVLLFPLSAAIIISVVYGLTILAIFSYKIAKKRPWGVVLEHLVIALIVIVITHYVGDLIGKIFV